MELSCESLRSEDRRSASSKFVELHVLYVPDDQWNVKLNKVPAEAIETFISAGFIRVYPDVTLKTLRSELGSLLGTERSVDRFSFLKCVGRSLALVKSKQERDLKVKTFAPPYAPQPELYLLPTVETDCSICSQSFTPDTSSSFPDHHAYYQPSKTCSLPTGTKEPVKFPLMAQCSHQPPPTSSLEEEEEEEEEEEKEDEDEERGEDEAPSYSCSEAEEENEEERLSSNKPEWESERAPPAVLLNKALRRHKADLAPAKRETCRKKQKHGADSGAAESPVDRGSGFSLTNRRRKPNNILKSTRSKPAAVVIESPAAPPQPAGCSSPPPGMDLASESHTTSASLGSQATRDDLMEDIKLVRGERTQLEWTRQELLRKGKELLALNRHRRNQARDSWKKKYFETKKVTAPLEDDLRNLRLELETFYNKLLHQLQARENRGKPRQQGRPSIKNELIIQIMTESHEIDNLKRKMEDAKMKLVTEIKLRKQAATELRALKVELAQKKSQSSHAGPTACLSKTTASKFQTRRPNKICT